MENVIIFGTTDLAEVLIYHIQNDDRYSISAITVDGDYINKTKGDIKERKILSNYPLVPFEDIVETYPPDKYSIFICIGYNNMNAGRKNVYDRIKSKGYKVLTYYHPSALVQSTDVGDGSLFFENVVVGPFCKIGICNIFYPNAMLAHHSVAGNFNYFCSACMVAGNVFIGNNCFFGINSTIKDGIKIADKTLVGAGTYLPHDSEKGGVYVPARSIKLEGKTSDDFLKSI